ncbi:MAG TPA: hypothetical protein VNW92_19395 [Polyangiaceae bacterium]|jgi:hypothetical protein|nr:hypothetical protein [Polyangiaceae bacterium]
MNQPIDIASKDESPVPKREVLDLIGTGGDNARFDVLALRLFRWHVASIPQYRAFCERRLKNFDSVDSWRKIPALPVEAFKYAELSAVPASEIVRRFATSGTTRGRADAARPGVSPFDVEALEIMHAAIEANAAKHLFCDGVRCRIFVLTPQPEDAPQMIMVNGMRQVMSRFGAEGSGFFGSKQGIDLERLMLAIDDARKVSAPVCLIGASFSFVHLLDALSAANRAPIVLPEGSRVMDAGGYKGRSRELSPHVFRELVSRAFSIPERYIVNLLGMTELASQVYDNSLSTAGREAPDERCKVPPPWMRTRVADVDDPGRDAAPGELGFLVHYDLANFSRPIAIMSDDLGRSVGSGFHIVSRVKTSEPRGCSVSVDELWRRA